MAKNRSDIRSVVRDVLDEDPAADWTDAELNTLVNIYYHEVYSAIVDVFENYETTTAQSNSVADQQEYSLPSDVLKVRRVEINYDVSATNSAPMRALPVPIDAVRRDLANTNLGVTINRGPVYYLRGDNIGFIPVPTRAGTNAIQIWYAPVRSDLTNDTTNIDIPYPDRDYKLIAYGAIADALRFGQQESIEADKFDRKFTRGVEKMQERSEDRIADEVKGVVDTTAENMDFGQNYY